MSDTKPLSSPRKNLGCLIFFFAIFIAAGAGEFLFLFAPAAYHIAQARLWTAVPCEIISSKLVLTPGRRSSNYAIHIRFRYEFGGERYESDRYQFLSGSGIRDYSAQNAIVKRLHHGTRATCFVNPLHPEEAVIERGWTQNMWPVLISSVAFMAAGVFFMVFSLKNAGQTTRAVPLDSEISHGELLLKQRMGPLGQFAVVLFVAILFNGVAFIFVREFVQSWMRKQPQYGLAIFLIPGVCVAVLFVILAVVKFLAFFDPRPQLTLANGNLTPGATTELRWQFSGRYDRISRLQLFLHGREEATFQAGKNSRTVTSTFLKSQIFDSTRPLEMLKRKAMLNIPAGTMHTFTASNNKIAWLIQLQADITGLPDLKEEFPLIVHPMPVNPTGKSS